MLHCAGICAEYSELIWSNEECELLRSDDNEITCKCNVLAGFFAVLIEPNVSPYTFICDLQFAVLNLRLKSQNSGMAQYIKSINTLLVHGQVTIIFVVSVGLSVCLFVHSFSQPSLIPFRSNLDICYMSGSSCVP